MTEPVRTVRTTNVEFPGSAGGTLVGRLEEPEGGAAAYGLFAHCFTCTKDVNAAARVARGLAERGIGVLRFDFSGLGHSSGEFAQTTFASNVEDLLAAAAWLGAERAEPRLLVGHSLGGAAVLAAAGRLASVTAVATIGAPAEPAHVGRLLDRHAEEIRSRGEAEVTLGGRAVTIGRAFLEDLDSHRPRDYIPRLGRALLLLHAPTDHVVGIDNAATIFGLAKHPKSFVSLAGADHMISRSADAAFATEVIAAWARRYVADPA